MEPTLHMLERRTARLEKTNKLLTLAVGACLIVFLYGAATRPDTLRARAFQLVADNGDVHGELVIREGNPGLYLMDAAGTERVAVFHEPDASGVYVSDIDGVTRIGVAQFAHGGGGLALHGPESKGAAVLYLKKEGSLRFYDADGNVTNEVRGAASQAEN